MSLLLQDVLTAIRDRSAAFHKSRVTDAVLARFLSDYQNELIAEAVKKDKQYLSQSVAIALAIDAANNPGTVGAGTSGGLPAAVDSGGTVSVVQESAGALVENPMTVAEGGNIVVAERVVTASTSTTVTSAGAGRTTNQDIGRLVHITAGTGRDQVREIASNTADQWTVSAVWDTIPDDTSLFTIVQALLTADEDLGVVTELPTQSSRTGYLVRLNALGVPYIDYTKPLTVWLDRGCPLPSMVAPLGGTVRYRDRSACPLTITSFAHRFRPAAMPAVYVMGEELHLCGDEGDWTDVVSLDIRYVPIAPVFTARTEYFLLPDVARPTLVAQGAAAAAAHVHGRDGITIDVQYFATKGLEAEDRYLNTIANLRGARVAQIREEY